MTARLALALLVGATLLPTAAQAERPRFEMVFYQPDLAEGLTNPVRRAHDLDRAREAGVQHVVLQYLGYGDWTLLDPWPNGVDPVRELMDEAHARGMKVWLGTWEDPRIWRQKRPPLWLWKAVADKGIAVALRAAERFADHPGFGGWYWTPEAIFWSTPGPRRLEQLSLVTREAVAELRKITPGKPVAIVFGASGRGEGNLLGDTWCRYIEASEPDVVVVMDGVGSAHVDVLLVPALYQLARRCSDRIGAQVWADMEFFSPDLESKPSWERLERQYRAARETVSVVGAFDLPHHLAVGTQGHRFLEGATPRGTEVWQHSRETDPGGDWLERPLARRGSVTVGLGEALVPVQRVEVVTRGLHPRSISIAAFGRAARWEEWGLLEKRHGPARDEWTWVYEATSTREATQVRVFAEGGRRGIRVDSIRVFRP